MLISTCSSFLIAQEYFFFFRIIFIFLIAQHIIFHTLPWQPQSLILVVGYLSHSLVICLDILIIFRVFEVATCNIIL